jgi:1,4-dihydroxy-2-naphthoate octaprenyltransferase
MTQTEAILEDSQGRPGKLMTWIVAARSWTLTVSSGAVLVGTAAAVYHGHFSPVRFVLALIGAVAIQAGTNLVNDYSDFVSGVDSFDVLAVENFGPSLAIQRRFLRPEQVWAGGVAAFALGSAIGLWLAYRCGWPVLAIGVPSVAAGYFYTGAPLALGYLALGDLLSFLFLGPAIVLGAYYVTALKFSAAAVWVSLSMGFLGSGILQVNNLRDIASDSTHGKRTLATILGRRGAFWELACFNAAAYGAVLAGVVTRTVPVTGLVVLATLPHALKVHRLCRASEGAALHPAINLEAQLHLEFAVLLTVSFLAAKALGV